MQNHCKDEQNKQDSQNIKDGPGAHYHHSYCVIISL